MMMDKNYSTDVVIIGAGPVGLFAVFECGMLKMQCHVIDSLEQIGGQLTALYPEKPIYDIPGYPHILAGGLVEKLEEQAKPFSPVYHLNRKVIGIKTRPDGRWEVSMSSGETLDCAAVIIAGGTGAFGPNRPPLEGLSEFEGKSVFYLVRKRDDFSGKTAVIAGGGDSAVDWAVSLSSVAKKIYVVHRRDKFRAAPAMVQKMHDIAESGKIELVIPAQLHALKGDNGLLRGVEVADLDGNKKTLQADVLLPFFGIAPQLGPIESFGVHVEQHHIPVNPATAETGLKGVFAVGDIAAYPGKLKLILTGFSDAARAAHSIHPLVFPGQEIHFIYSTEKGVP